jgi:L-aminopeptidase/D-esterase-like protein
MMAAYGPDRDLVSGAIVNDGRRRANQRYPDRQLGADAFHSAAFNQFPLGAAGAGRNVWVGGGRGLGKIGWIKHHVSSVLSFSAAAYRYLNS